MFRTRPFFTSRTSKTASRQTKFTLLFVALDVIRDGKVFWCFRSISGAWSSWRGAFTMLQDKIILCNFFRSCIKCFVKRFDVFVWQQMALIYPFLMFAFRLFGSEWCRIPVINNFDYCKKTKFIFATDVHRKIHFFGCCFLFLAIFSINWQSEMQKIIIVRGVSDDDLKFTYSFLFILFREIISL